MRIALLGDFDTFLFRGLERPLSHSYYRLSPGLNLARGFSELGIRDVHYLVVTPEVNRPTIDQGPFGVLHRLPCPRFSGSTGFFLWRRRLLLQELARIQPDIVHGQGTEREYAFTAVTSPYPSVVTIHGIMHRVHRVTPPPLLSLNRVPRWIEKIVTRKATDVICLSRAVEDFFHERRSPARCHLIPNAVAPCFFEVRPRPRTKKKQSILFVGNIYPLKGLDYLVDALAIVLKRIESDIVLRVIGGKSIGEGEPAYQSMLRERATRLGIADHIEWLGVRREQEVAAALRQTDVLVLPSFQETAPMSVAEAMAVGVPVVATRVGGTPELVEHEKTGLLVAPGNSEELADAIRRLLADAELRRRFGAEGRAKALERYAPRVVAEKTLAVYNDICQRERTGK